MTLINANMPKGAALVESSASSNSPSVDGVVAIFDAIMAAVAELDSGDLDMDMKQQAETMAAQLMADTSLQPYLDDTGKADLLPVISHLLGEADSASMEAAPDGLPGDHIHQLNALFSAPLAEAGVANNTADQAQKADAPEAEQSLLALSQSASRQPRGHYAKTKNPIQVLASLIRKTDNKSIDSQAPEASELNPMVLQNLDGTIPATGAIPEAQIVGEMSHANTIKAPPLRSWHPPLKPVHAAITDQYGPFAKNSPMAKATESALTEPAAMGASQLDLKSAALKSESAISTPADSKAQYRADIKSDAADKAMKSDDSMAKDEQAMMASTIKSQRLSASLSGQQITSSGTSAGASAAAMAATPMSDADQNGDFSGHQQHRQQNPQANSQANAQANSQSNAQANAQSDASLDTRMGLDQGRDGRLLRLNMNDANWSERLLRNIQSNGAKGSDETIRIILEPARLGRLVVQVNMTGQTSHVQITSATAEAAAMLADAEPKLQQALEQHGLKLQMQTSMGQGFSHHSAQQGSNGQGSNGQGSGATEDDSKNATKNATNGDDESTKILEDAKTGKVNILA